MRHYFYAAATETTAYLYDSPELARNMAARLAHEPWNKSSKSREFYVGQILARDIPIESRHIVFPDA